MCTGHSKQGLSDASDLKNPGEQAGGHRDGHQFNHDPPKATLLVGPHRGTPRRLLNLSGPVFSLVNQVVMTKCTASTQSWAPRKCLTPCSKLCTRATGPPPGPCPSLVLQAPSHPRTPPRACLVPFNPCRAARGVPISASSRPGQELHLHRGPLLTDGHHSLSPAARHAHSGCHPCGCPLHPRTRLPSCSGAGPPGSRPGQAPSIFCGAAPRTESFPPLTRAARKQLFLPRWKVLSWPGRAG